MMNARIQALATGSFLLVGALSSGAQQQAADFSAIDSYVTGEMRAERIPGVALAIVHGSRVVHARGFGVDGAGRSVTPQTSFVIGSMSKPVTALALMQLVDAGLVDLDAPVQRYLPGFRVADRAASQAITVRQLLHHTSGIPADAARGSDSSLTLDAHVRELAKVELGSSAGTRHEYSSSNYLVAGAIVEKASGMSFGDYVRARIFDPLEMRHSFVDQDDAIRGGMSRGHRYLFGYPRPARLRHEADRLPTAALISSAEDLGHFMIAQLDSGNFRGRSVLSANGMRRMHRPGVDVGGFSYAIGWRVSRGTGGASVIHHGGIVPHFRGKMVMLPAQGWGVVVLTNVSSALPLSPASHRMADNVGAYLAGVPLPEPGSRFKLVYLVITLVVLLLTVNQVRQGVAAWRHRKARAQVSRKVLASEGAQLLLPVALLAGLPLMVGLPWREALRSMPDVAWWLIAIASADIAVRVFRISALVRSRP